jgi:iron complex outermembrane recepter protein
MTVRLLLFIARCLLALFSALTAAASAAVTRFDIPAQAAPSAIQVFMKQSGTQVVYLYDDLKAVKANAVSGAMEPPRALEQLLAGTGFGARQNDPGTFVVSDTGAKPGEVEGRVRDASGRPISGAKIAMVGTGLSAITDRRGRFALTDVPPGEHTLQVMAEGLQNTKVTDVSVSEGRRLTLSTITLPARSAGVVQLEDYIVSAKKNDGVIELDPYEVAARRAKPFTDGNVDIPRTIDDAQPYQIFDAAAIDLSGAANLGDFLKERLAMNAAFSTASESIGSQNVRMGTGSNASSIDLRGLGADKTLILVNGRRIAGQASLTADGQPDINGIPTGAVERIEVLSASASALYGGNALGGVVNIITKRNYSGGELQLRYENDFKSDAARKVASLRYTLPLEGGKSSLTLRGSWNISDPLRLADRRIMIDRGIGRILANAPEALYSPTQVWFGAYPNILPTSATQTTLTLRNGVVIPSRFTHISPGTAPGLPGPQLYAMLAANGGVWNTDLAPTTQFPTGLKRTLGSETEVRAFGAELRRPLGSRVDLTIDASYSVNRGATIYNDVGSVVIPANSPVNPFTTQVRVALPADFDSWGTSENTTSRTTVGLVVRAPADWTLQGDYSWSEQATGMRSAGFIDSTSRNLALADGTINPFADTLLYPTPVGDYMYFSVKEPKDNRTVLHDVSVRGHGPFFNLPWGQPTLTGGASYQRGVYHWMQSRAYALRPEANTLQVGFPKKRETASIYGELQVPLVPSNRYPGLHELSAQIAGRIESHAATSGTTWADYRDGQVVGYAGPLRNGQPFSETNEYRSNDGTIGLKYSPIRSLILRGSVATAFLPPDPANLVPGTEPSPFPTTIVDPANGNITYSIQTISGGNPGLKPQTATSYNAGIIWQPQGERWARMRVNLEFYRIEQQDVISSLPAQTLVDLASIYGGRITRGADNRIISVDTSLLNLYGRDTEGFDVEVSYGFNSFLGNFQLTARHSIIRSLKEQYAVDVLAYEAVDHPYDGGAVRHRSNAQIDWRRGAWSAGWAGRHFASYKAQGAAGSPTSQRFYNGGVTTPIYIKAQGGDSIPTQDYHDLYVGYSFGKGAFDRGRADAC